MPDPNPGPKIGTWGTRLSTRAGAKRRFEISFLSTNPGWADSRYKCNKGDFPAAAEQPDTEASPTRLESPNRAIEKLESKERFPLSNSPCYDGTFADFRRFLRTGHLLHLEFECAVPHISTRSLRRDVGYHKSRRTFVLIPRITGESKTQVTQNRDLNTRLSTRAGANLYQSPPA